MGKLVKEMERVGYVKRHIDETDKRAKIIQLTTMGEQLVHDSMEIVDEITAEYIQSIGLEDFKSLDGLLNQAVKKLGLRFLTKLWDGERKLPN